MAIYAATSINGQLYVQTPSTLQLLRLDIVNQGAAGTVTLQRVLSPGISGGNVTSDHALRDGDRASGCTVIGNAQPNAGTQQPIAVFDAARGPIDFFDRMSMTVGAGNALYVQVSSASINVTAFYSV